MALPLDLQVLFIFFFTPELLQPTLYNQNVGVEKRAQNLGTKKQLQAWLLYIVKFYQFLFMLGLVSLTFCTSKSLENSTNSED